MINKELGEADGSSRPALLSHPLQHPGEGKSLLQGVTLTRMLRLQLPGKARLHPLLWTALSLSAFTFKSASRGSRAGRSPPSHGQKCNCVPQLEENTGNTNWSPNSFLVLFHCKFKWPWHCEALSFILKAEKIYSTQK